MVKDLDLCQRILELKSCTGIIHISQCPQTIENRAPFKASFVDLLVLYRFLVISDFDV